MRASGPSSFSLGDLLDCRELGLELVTGDAGCLARGVRGVHCIDLPEPADWLDRDWVLLTTGMRLDESAAHDERFLDGLVRTGVVAVGFALGVIHQEVPATLLAAAAVRNFPIFTVPLPTPFRDVTTLVFQAVCSAEVRASHRLVAMQRYLMESMSDEAPKEGLLRRLASLLDARVGLLNAGGRVEFESSSLPLEAILEKLAETVAASVVALEVAGLHGFAIDVGGDAGTGGRRLVVVWPDGHEVPLLAKPVAQLAAPLLDAIARLARAEVAETRAVRRATLEALIEPDGIDDARILDARCRAYGLDLAQGICAVAVRPAGDAGPKALVETCEATMERTGVPFLAGQRGSKVVVLMPAVDATDELVARHLLAGDATLRAGVGRVVVDSAGIARSWADAQLAVDDRTQRGRAVIVRYDDLDLVTILLNEIPTERLEPKINELLAPLRRKPLIYEALVSYLSLNQDVGRTARALKLHPNSVRYRLTRAEEILGVSIRSSATIVALHVALALDEDMEEPWLETAPAIDAA